MLILTSLSDGPKHGYAIITDVAAFSGVGMEPGTLYGALSRLEKTGLDPAAGHRRAAPPVRDHRGRPGRSWPSSSKSMQQVVRTCGPAHRDRVGEHDARAWPPGSPVPWSAAIRPCWQQRYREEMLDVLDQHRAIPASSFAGRARRPPTWTLTGWEAHDPHQE